MVAKQWSHLVFLQCQIYFPLHFSFKNYWDRSRIFWGSQEFFYAARKRSHILLHLSLKFSSLLSFSFTGDSISCYFHGSTWVSPWSSTLLPLTRGLQTLLRWGWSWRPAPDHCLLHHLCSHQRCQDGTRSSHCKQNPTGWICQEWFSPPLGLLLMCSKQGRTHLEEHGILDVRPSDTLLIWAPNLNWCCYQGHDSVSWDWREDTVVQTQCTVCSEWQKLV